MSVKKSIFTFIVRQRKAVIVFYLAVIVLCAYISGFVKVDSDLSHYLPKDSDSTVDLHIMEESFYAQIPNAQFMVRDLSVKEASDLKEKIGQVEGVINVSWLSDLNVMNAPVSILPKSLVEQYYRDGNALFTITFDNEYSMDTMNEIRAMTEKESWFSGNFVNAKVAQATARREVYFTVGLVVIFAAFLLFLILTSFAEVAALIACLMSAVMINAGTNLIFGTISTMTNISSSVLQMGVCVDYSIFLMHRYDYYRRNADPETAMIRAMDVSLLSVASSSVTTMIGFAALIFMRYRIGMDMGIVMAKGVAVSLITSFTMLPCVILMLDRLIQKHKHRPLGERADGFAKISMAARYPVMAVFAAAAAISLLSIGKNLFYYGTAHIYKDNNIVVTDRAEIESVFGRENQMVLLVPADRTAAEAKMIKQLKDTDQLKSITSFTELFGPLLPEKMVPEYYRKLLRSESYSRIILNYDLDEESEETFGVIEAIKRTAEDFFPGESHLIGNSVSVHDLKKVISADNIRINLITGSAIFMVLILTLRSLLLPVILTLCIEGSAWITMASFVPEGKPIFYIGYLVVTSILLGCTVDYAILVTSRYRELKAAGDHDPVRNSVSLSASSVITSALILTSGGVGLWLLSTNQLVAQLGVMLGRGTVTAAAVVLFALPGFLSVYDRIRRRKN